MIVYSVHLKVATNYSKTDARPEKTAPTYAFLSDVSFKGQRSPWLYSCGILLKFVAMLKPKNTS
jgi:hypothetical protein